MRFLMLLLISSVSAEQIRVATYNASLALNSRGQLAATLRNGDFSNARRVAEVVQIVQPDVLLLNEFDFDANGTAATRLNNNYFKVSQNGRTPQDYPYRYVAPSNTGIHSGFDFDNNGSIDDTPGDQGYGGDAFGFGEFEGKFAMVVFSKFPIEESAVRTFEKVLWKDMPGNLLPASFYSEEEQNVFRLSSKGHWDVPIDINGNKFHFLVSHPTPPVFDGPEDRNGRRNHDEIRLWADYLTPGANDYLGAGFPSGARFVIAGDQNADPTRGDSVDAAINQLLDHPAVDNSFTPVRTGAPTGVNGVNTSSFSLRVDYVLPSKMGFNVLDGAVFWPTSGQDGANLISVSDHRLVYLDLEFTPIAEEAVRDLSLCLKGDQVTLQWLTQPDATYGIQISDDLSEDSWQPVESFEITIVDGLAEVILSKMDLSKFLRITVS